MSIIGGKKHQISCVDKFHKLCLQTVIESISMTFAGGVLGFRFGLLIGLFVTHIQVCSEIRCLEKLLFT